VSEFLAKWAVSRYKLSCQQFVEKPRIAARTAWVFIIWRTAWLRGSRPSSPRSCFYSCLTPGFAVTSVYFLIRLQHPTLNDLASYALAVAIIWSLCCNAVSAMESLCMNPQHAPFLPSSLCGCFDSEMSDDSHVPELSSSAPSCAPQGGNPAKGKRMTAGDQSNLACYTCRKSDSLQTCPKHSLTLTVR
jgi:hypothetical protein